jgi:serine phosphatase RsbU (regulator of sigma subunit)
MPIGKGERLQEFQLTQVEMREGDKLYLFTDGYADQFGGPKGKKFKYRQLQELLMSLGDVPFAEQRSVLDAIHLEWKGALEQTDDLLVIGIQV